MQSKPHSPWWPRIATFLLWVVAAASLAFWGLKWSATGAKLPGVAAASAGAATLSDPQALARMFGAGASVAPVVMAAAAAASRYALMGVVAGPRGAGVALISVDGKPARPFEVGATVDAQLVLKSVASRQATLAGSVDAPPAVTLELPPMKRLSTPGRSEPPPPTPMSPLKPNPFEGNPFKPSITPN